MNARRDMGARVSSPVGYAASQAQRIDKILHFPLLKHCSQAGCLRSHVVRASVSGAFLLRNLIVPLNTANIVAFYDVDEMNGAL
jgi:hypothetical protein